MIVQKVPAHLWNGNQTLNGHLVLRSNALTFECTDFSRSHLELQIPLAGIERVEPFLVFDYANKGLRITSHDGREDLFVLEDPLTFRGALQQLLNNQAISTP